MTALTWNKPKELLEKGFRHFIPEFVWQPEYDELVSWMTNTRGKGLFLQGHSGRGKTVFLTKILPILLQKKGINLHTIKAINLRRDCKAYLAVDETGYEPKVWHEGHEIDAFPLWIDWCADFKRPPFFTTNMSLSEFKRRYGEHIYNRADALCKRIKFEGKSLWNKNEKL